MNNSYQEPMVPAEVAATARAIFLKLRKTFIKTGWRLLSAVAAVLQNSGNPLAKSSAPFMPKNKSR